MKFKYLSLILVLFWSFRIFAAVGCDLNDPDKDVKRLFPQSTGFKTIYTSIKEKGGDVLLQKVEDRLGDKFKGLYETADVPYTMYKIFKNKEIIGYIHGVNQKGSYGGLQVFLALDTNGKVVGFYYQKLTSKFGKEFRSKDFAEQFIGLTLKDFLNYDVVAHKAKGTTKVTNIKNPAPQAEDDFNSTLRAAKKNLILVDEFLLKP